MAEAPNQVFPALATARLDLRALNRADAPFLLKLFSDPEVLRFYDARPYGDVSAAADQVDLFDARFRQGTGIRWGFQSRQDGSLRGHGGLGRLDHSTGTGLLGFVLARDAWGQGLGTEAVEAILRFGRDHLHLRRIEAEVRPGNGRSERLLLRLGFVPEGDRVRDLFGEPANFRLFAWTPQATFSVPPVAGK